MITHLNQMKTQNFIAYFKFLVDDKIYLQNSTHIYIIIQQTNKIF